MQHNNDACSQWILIMIMYLNEYSDSIDRFRQVNFIRYISLAKKPRETVFVCR